MSLSYRREIDGLRAIAVVPVILFHAGFSAFSGGFVGVDVFFVISGYLITSLLLNDLAENRFSIVRFYERRARRILPALFLVLAVTLLIGSAAVVDGVPLMLPFELRDMTWLLASVLVFASNFVLVQQSGYFAPSSEANPLVHTWSLAVEEQFYILFPLVLWVVWRYAPRALWLVGLVSFTASLGLAEYMSGRNEDLNFFLLPSRSFELIAGVLVALWFRGHPGPMPRALGEALGFAGLAAIATAVYLFDAGTPFPSVWGLIPVLGTAAILLGASPKTVVGRALGWQPCVAIGLVSYSAYLWHQPLLAFARHALNITDLPSHVAVGLILATFLLAWFSWAFVERPFRRPDGIKRREVFLYSGLASVALAAVAIPIYLTNGLPQRFPAFQQPWVLSSPSELKEYNAAGYDLARNRALATDRPNLVLVGDSFSQDLFNIIAETGSFPGYAISTIYIPARCQIHYDMSEADLATFIVRKDWPTCARSELDQTQMALIRNADIVFFASSWREWGAQRFATTLAAMAIPEDVQILVLGPKGVLMNRRALAGYSAEQAVNARLPATEQAVVTDKLLKQQLPDTMYVDVLSAFCPDGCPLFTPQSDLISPDGMHLTKEGAVYVGNLLFKLPILAPYASKSIQ